MDYNSFIKSLIVRDGLDVYDGNVFQSLKEHVDLDRTSCYKMHMVGKMFYN